MSKRECPFCDEEVITVISYFQFVGPGFRSYCKSCHARGKQFEFVDQSLHAFCHPAHISKGMVSISIETVDACLFAMSLFQRELKKNPDVEADILQQHGAMIDELTAAMNTATSPATSPATQPGAKTAQGFDAGTGGKTE